MPKPRPFTGVITEHGSICMPIFESNELYLIPSVDNKRVIKVKVGTGPSAVTYSENFIYVANSGSDDVSVIDGNTNQVVNTIKVGTGPSSITYFPAIHKIYVANSGSNDVSVIHEDHFARSSGEPKIESR